MTSAWQILRGTSVRWVLDRYIYNLTWRLDSNEVQEKDLFGVCRIGGPSPTASLDVTSSRAIAVINECATVLSRTRLSFCKNI